MVIVEEPANPVPDTVTVVPTLPLVGFKVIDDATVNEAVGELVPSVKVNVWLPGVEAGTVNVADKPPEAVQPEQTKK